MDELIFDDPPGSLNSGKSDLDFQVIKPKKKAGLKKFLTWVIMLTILGVAVNEAYRSLKITDSNKYSDLFNIVTFKNGKVALTDFSGRILSKKVDEIFLNPFSSEDDTLTIFIRKGKRGFLSNQTGKTVIPAQFEYAWHFDPSSGLAAVCLNDSVGFIDAQGTFRITPQYLYSINNENYKTYEDLAEEQRIEEYSYDEEDEENEEKTEEEFVKGFIFQNGYCIVPNERKFGLINSKNVILLSPEYDWISPSVNGIRIIRSGGKYGLFQEKTDKIVRQPQYSSIGFTDPGILIEDSILNFPAKFLESYNLKKRTPVFDDVTELLNEGTGEYSGFSRYTIGEKCGILEDVTGQVVCPARFDEIDYLSPGIFKAVVGDLKFLIDKNGEMIHSIQLEEPVNN